MTAIAASSARSGRRRGVRALERLRAETGATPERADEPLDEQAAGRARKLDCTLTRRCLEVAELSRWPAFACRCTAFTPPDTDQRVRDFGGLIMVKHWIDGRFEFPGQARG